MIYQSQMERPLYYNEEIIKTIEEKVNEEDKDSNKDEIEIENKIQIAKAAISYFMQELENYGIVSDEKINLKAELDVPYDVNTIPVKIEEE